jgi:sterol desaturase/sphingolipid hydroxylase (fatty acid hydroxylase superfamily)
MNNYWQLIKNSYQGYTQWFIDQITFQSQPWYYNYFWMLTIVSLIFILLEAAKPWRKDQPVLRKDFWLDFFYMYFNFFLFSLVIYEAGSNVVVNLFRDLQQAIGVDLIGVINVAGWPVAVQLIVYFILRDFIQWNTHILLHKIPFLWNFHKVHHSVKEMGFAAHLRFHWMENVVYGTIQYLPLAMIGFNLDHAFFVYMFTTVIGHWNHTNFTINIGPLKYLFNNPEMHIWHHAKHLPADRMTGVNFGLTLSIWDYIFGTNYIPYNGRDIELGFAGDEEFPKDFAHQNLYGFGMQHEKDAPPYQSDLVDNK